MVLNVTFPSHQIVAGILAFFGVAIITDPFSLHEALTSLLLDSSSGSVAAQSTFAKIPSVTSFHRNAAIALGVFSALATASGFTTIRLVGDRAHVLIQVNYYSMVSTIISGMILLLPIPTLPLLGSTGFCLPATYREWVLLAFIGLSGFMLQFLMTAGL